MITVLYPVVNACADEITRIENLYEQTYSNYECRVLDLSTTRQPSALLETIPHPATAFSSCLGLWSHTRFAVLLSSYPPHLR